MTIADCTILDSTQNGIMAASPALIQSCQTDLCDGTGVYLAASAENSIVSNSRISHCGLRGISHSSYPSFCLITGNRIWNCGREGIGTSNSWQVHGNIIDEISIPCSESLSEACTTDSRPSVD